MIEIKDKIETRGRPITCKICGHKFKLLTKNEKIEWQENKQICPRCENTYATKPETEKQLMDLQDKFFKSKRHVKYMNEIIKISSSYCESIIKKCFSNMIHSTNQLKYYKDNAISFFIEEYYNNKNYYVWGSFFGALKDKIKQAIFGKQEHKVGQYSLDYEFEDGNQVVFPAKDNVEKKIHNEINIKELLKNMKIMINYGFLHRLTNYELFRMKMGLYLIMYGNKRVMHRYFKNNKKGKHYLFRLLSLIKKDIYNVLN